MRIFNCFFFFFLFSCNNTIDLNSDGWVNSDDDVFVLKKKTKPYVLNDVLIIPENKTFYIDNGVHLILKKGRKIVNGGTLILGKKNSNDSLYSFHLKESFLDSVFYYSVELSSSSEKFIFSKENSVSGVFNINNTFLKNINFSCYEKNKININNSVFNNSIINTENSNTNISYSYFNKVIINKKNSSVVFNNSVFNNLKKPIYIDSSNSIINNCLFINSTKSLAFYNSHNNNILNSVFYKNNIGINIIKSGGGYYKFFNNIFIDNNIVLNSIDSSSFYFMNNVFDKNNTVLKYKLNNNCEKPIISKNNIYYNNKINFDLENIKISNSYCISNIDSLEGYYNIFDNPLFINSNNFNYVLNDSSPGLRSGINNLNLGVNINNINIIKYLK